MDGLVPAVVLVYTFGWIAVLQGVTVWQAIAPPSKRRSRFLVASALAWPPAGKVLAAAYASGGPWFDARIHPYDTAFSATGAFVQSVSGRTLWAQQYLWTAY